jgi:ligand-binding sensor domain-containing protein
MEHLFEDKEGGLWIVSSSHGALRLKNSFVRMLTRNPDKDCLNPWQPVMVASSGGRVHVASICSIDMLDQDGQFDPLAHQVSTHPVSRLRYMGLAFSNEVSQESTLWAGLKMPADMYTEDMGSVPVLMRWDSMTQECEFVHYPEYPQGSQDLSSMAVRGREVWMANYAGAYIYNTETEVWTVWHEKHGIDQFPINTLYLDSHKQLWLGSEGGGLYREKPN